MNQEIVDELSELKEEVNNLKKEIQSLRHVIEQLTGTCGRMDDHISFVNSTYNVVRRPFSMVLDVISRSLGNGRVHNLPELEN